MGNNESREFSGIRIKDERSDKRTRAYRDVSRSDRSVTVFSPSPVHPERFENVLAGSAFCHNCRSWAPISTSASVPPTLSPERDDSVSMDSSPSDSDIAESIECDNREESSSSTGSEQRKRRNWVKRWKTVLLKKNARSSHSEKAHNTPKVLVRGKSSYWDRLNEKGRDYLAKMRNVSDTYTIPSTKQRANCYVAPSMSTHNALPMMQRVEELKDEMIARASSDVLSAGQVSEIPTSHLICDNLLPSLVWRQILEMIEQGSLSILEGLQRCNDNDNAKTVIRGPGRSGKKIHGVDVVTSFGEDFERWALKMHQLLAYIVRNDYVAPIQQPRRILDVGCLEGSWVRSMATHFPDALVHGLDASSYYTYDVSSFPQNCRIVSINPDKKFPCPAETFDFIHQRLLGHFIPLEVWPARLLELHRLLKHGGFLEIIEQELPPINMGPKTSRLNDYIQRVLDKYGMNVSGLSQLDILLRMVGFQRIHHQVVDMPMGSHAGPAGEHAMRAYRRFVSSMRDTLLTVGLDQEHFDELLEGLDAEVNTHETSILIHFYWCSRGT